MTQHNSIKLFEEKRVRTVWDDQQEKWYFSVIDVVAVLTDSVNPTDYFKKMRKRDPQLAAFVGTNCPQVAMLTENTTPFCHPERSEGSRKHPLCHRDFSSLNLTQLIITCEP